MIQVWAPFAKSVRIEVGGEAIDLDKTEWGWWIGPYSLEHGEDYSFDIDGNSGIPDPRSPWQPYGVHGRSRHLDHSNFRWTDRLWQPKPLASAVIYEMHIGTFTSEGTFVGAVDKLDNLVDLGITHIEIMPVASFLGEYGWGYDGVDLFAPHEAYGGPNGLKALVDACHRRGLAVVLDVVYNHLGPDGNYLPKYGPYLTDKYRTPWGQAVNVDDAESDEVRRFI